MANYNTYNMASVLLIVAAFFGIVSFFCGWFVYDGLHEGGAKAIITGSGMLDGEIKGFFDGNQFIPLYILILSAIALIIAFLPKMGVNIPAPRYSVMLVIVGLAILILAIVYGAGYYEPKMFEVALGGASGFKFAGPGLWFAMISGILILFVGALPAFTKKV